MIYPYTRVLESWNNEQKKKKVIYSTMKESPRDIFKYVNTPETNIILYINYVSIFLKSR